MASHSTIVSNFIHKIPLTAHKSEINEAQKNAISTAFYACDLGHKGYLTREDVQMAIVSLFGYKPSKPEVNQLMGLETTNVCEPLQGLKLEAFIEGISLKMAAQDEDEMIRQIFLVFDSQCRGFLTIQDMKKAISQVAPHLPQHTIESAFREADRDGDGRVSYTDFEFMMKYNSDDGF